MKREGMLAHRWCVSVVFAFGIVGCGPRTPATRVAPPARASASTVDQVCRSAAELLGVDRAKVHAETSLGDLGADELDFVELVMELEEHYQVFLPDEALKQTLGTDNWQEAAENVTMAKLAAVVDEQMRRAGARPSHAPEAAAGPGSDGGGSPPE